MELKTNAALIIIDQQKGILHPKLGRRNNPQAEARILELLGHWRRTGRAGGSCAAPVPLRGFSVLAAAIGGGVSGAFSTIDG